MSKLAIGTAQFGNFNYGVANQSNQNFISPPEIFDILNYATRQGISLLDTASSYGGAEAMLGQFQLGAFKIVGKLPAIAEEIDSVRSSVKQLICNSLSMLGVEKFYGFLLHNPRQLNSSIGQCLYYSLMSAKDSELVEKIGISVYEPQEIELYLSRYKFDIVQLPLNIFDRRFLKGDLIKKLCDDGVEIHARSIFLQGLLLMPSNERPDYFSKWQTLWNKWDDWLRYEDVDPLQACKAFVESIPELSRIIVGVNGINQLKNIVETKKKYIEFPNFQIKEKDLLDPRYWLI